MSTKLQVSYDEFKLLKQRNADQDKQIAAFEREIDDLKRELDEKDNLIKQQEAHIARLAQSGGKIPRGDGPLQWNEDMVRRFRAIVADHQGLMTQEFWERTAEYVGGGCADFDCREMWKHIKDENAAADRRPWSRQDEEALLRAVDTWVKEKNVIIHRGQPIIHWRYVGMTLNRNPHTCENKWNALMQAQNPGFVPGGYPQTGRGPPTGAVMTTGGGPAVFTTGAGGPRGPPAYQTGSAGSSYPPRGNGYGEPRHTPRGPPGAGYSTAPRGYLGSNPRGGGGGYGGYGAPAASAGGYGGAERGAPRQYVSSIPRTEKRDYTRGRGAPGDYNPSQGYGGAEDGNYQNDRDRGGDTNNDNDDNRSEGSNGYRGGGRGRTRDASRSRSPSRDDDGDHKRKRFG